MKKKKQSILQKKAEVKLSVIAGSGQKKPGEIVKHPCYSEDASHRFARMHVPVAPKCNIECNYCNRKYDCVSESRPGVTSHVLSPEEALHKVVEVKKALPQLSVVGIAGPGDPLANPYQTFKTFEMVKEKFPDMLLCLSTNGLVISDHISRIKELGISHVTITINALSPEVGGKIYRTVRLNGKVYRGKEGTALLIKEQLEGIKLLKEAGVLCKINSVMIPGINYQELPRISERIKTLGAFIHNIMPLIPCEGSQFHESKKPTIGEIKEMNLLCGGDMKMMRHCRQCRADAVGFLKDEAVMCESWKQRRQCVG